MVAMKRFKVLVAVGLSCLLFSSCLNANVWEPTEQFESLTAAKLSTGLAYKASELTSSENTQPVMYLTGLRKKESDLKVERSRKVCTENGGRVLLGFGSMFGRGRVLIGASDSVAAAPVQEEVPLVNDSDCSRKIVTAIKRSRARSRLRKFNRNSNRCVCK